MKMSASFLLLALALTISSGCGGSTADAYAPLTAEQKAAAAKEEADVQDAERAQQMQVQRKPAAKR